MEELFKSLQVAPLSLSALLINLVAAAAVSAVLGLHYRHFGSTLAGRSHFSRIFVFVALATTLIISIVKSSLALSLGLVGALSIVRFRTPVKEPEELAYLFLAIAVGLGFGADFRIETTLGTAVILGLVTVLQFARRKDDGRNLYVTLGIDSEAGAGALLGPINGLLEAHCGAVDLRRMDSDAGRVELTYMVDLPDPDGLARLAAALKDLHPGARLTVIDQQRMPAV